MRLNLEDLVGEQARLLLDAPDGAGDGQLGLERLEFVPALHSAMRFDGESQQIAHGVLLRGPAPTRDPGTPGSPD
jgi:hypothetical protein